MTSKLDHLIKTTLNGDIESPGIFDFADSTSAIDKAKEVVSIVNRYNLDFRKVGFISVGGADGTELQYLLNNTNSSYGILIEYSIDLCEKASSIADTLKKKEKHMDILPGDAVQRIDEAINKIFH
ncbi:MAG: hypothetical protein SCARUB_02006 [Candidatus Scalindua rubra]|uniref:Uncharacterized protein n=1 Tax=Candidatus Scalindua rubra TaxID=1872076 RepID=A0A1E3XB21_9BACT|nr:MAG: hypothetical protein SCARUB_02006 [Candidatus Scalindua rubra]